MRKIDPEFQARLDSGVTTLCRCWKLTCKDGAVFGFTDHDEPVQFGGLLFRAATGLAAGALQTGNGLSVDNGTAIGALSDSAINEASIRAGKFDRARVDQWLVDWNDPRLRLQIFAGTIGEVRRSDNGFEAELRGLAEELNVPVGRTILRTCDRVLGDSKCGVDLSASEFSAVTAVEPGSKGVRLIFPTLGHFPEGFFAHGTVLWTEGANAGNWHRIKEDRLERSRRLVELWERPSWPVEAGKEVVLAAGCDKQAETCRAKFRNFLNFRGFPHVPGEDWVIAFPQNGTVHDGQSRNGR